MWIGIHSHTKVGYFSFFRFQTAAYWQLAKFGKKEPLSENLQEEHSFQTEFIIIYNSFL